jgi:hypothetical protein
MLFYENYINYPIHPEVLKGAKMRYHKTIL